MYNHELFMEGHKQLIKLVQWIATPTYYAPRWNFDPSNMRDLREGGVILGDEPVGKGIEAIHVLPKEDVTLILKTFCESHLRLKHD